MKSLLPAAFALASIGAFVACPQVKDGTEAAHDDDKQGDKLADKHGGKKTAVGKTHEAQRKERHIPVLKFGLVPVSAG